MKCPIERLNLFPCLCICHKQFKVFTQKKYFSHFLHLNFASTVIVPRRWSVKTLLIYWPFLSLHKTDGSPLRVSCTLCLGLFKVLRWSMEAAVWALPSWACYNSAQNTSVPKHGCRFFRRFYLMRVKMISNSRLTTPIKVVSVFNQTKNYLQDLTGNKLANVTTGFTDVCRYCILKSVCVCSKKTMEQRKQK